VLHELGHFIPAKLFKTRVEKFYLFFDVKFSLFKKKIGETVYGIGWLPLGGYVKISGMIDESMDTEQMAQPAQPWEFRAKPTWQRLIIMLGGVTVNLALGFLIYMMVVFVWGKTVITNDNLEYGLAPTPTTASLGFAVGDKISSVDGLALDDAMDINKWLFLRDVSTVDVVRVDGTNASIPIPEDFGKQLFAAGEMIPFVAYIPAVIDRVVVGSSAEAAGLLANDQIVGIDGKAINPWHPTTPPPVQVSNAFKQRQAEKIVVQISRNNIISEIEIPVAMGETLGIYYKGTFPKAITHTYDAGQSIEEGFNYGYWTLYDYIAQFKFVFTKKGASQLGGFATIGSLFPSKWNWRVFWERTALISIILAFMNVLPIPALDGGHVVFLTYEMLTGRKPHQKVLEYAQMAGLILLLGLFVFANGNDIYRFILS
jgi:regulator of sigma E protease